MITDNEIWKDVPNYESLYQASNLGRIKSLGNNRSKKDKILKHVIKSGYHRVILWNKKKIKCYAVHQIIAITFLNHIPNGHTITVDHINNDKNDNSVFNLQLLTNKENITKRNHSYNEDGSILKNGEFTSKYIGVCWVKKDKRWSSRISVNGKQIHLGNYLNELDAHKARVKALSNLNSQTK